MLSGVFCIPPWSPQREVLCIVQGTRTWPNIKSIDPQYPQLCGYCMYTLVKDGSTKFDSPETSAWTRQEKPHWSRWNMSALFKACSTLIWLIWLQERVTATPPPQPESWTSNPQNGKNPSLNLSHFSFFKSGSLIACLSQWLFLLLLNWFLHSNYKLEANCSFDMATMSQCCSVLNCLLSKCTENPIILYDQNHNY